MLCICDSPQSKSSLRHRRIQLHTDIVIGSFTHLLTGYGIDKRITLRITLASFKFQNNPFKFQNNPTCKPICLPQACSILLCCMGKTQPFCAQGQVGGV